MSRLWVEKPLKALKPKSCEYVYMGSCKISLAPIVNNPVPENSFKMLLNVLLNIGGPSLNPKPRN